MGKWGKCFFVLGAVSWLSLAQAEVEARPAPKEPAATENSLEDSLAKNVLKVIKTLSAPIWIPTRAVLKRTSRTSPKTGTIEGTEDERDEESLEDELSDAAFYYGGYTSVAVLLETIRRTLLETSFETLNRAVKARNPNPPRRTLFLHPPKSDLEAPATKRVYNANKGSQGNVELVINGVDDLVKTLKGLVGQEKFDRIVIEAHSSIAEMHVGNKGLWESLTDLFKKNRRKVVLEGPDLDRIANLDIDIATEDAQLVLYACELAGKNQKSDGKTFVLNLGNSILRRGGTAFAATKLLTIPALNMTRSQQQLITHIFGLGNWINLMFVSSQLSKLSERDLKRAVQGVVTVDCTGNLERLKASSSP